MVCFDLWDLLYMLQTQIACAGAFPWQQLRHHFVYAGRSKGLAKQWHGFQMLQKPSWHQVEQWVGCIHGHLQSRLHHRQPNAQVSGCELERCTQLELQCRVCTIVQTCFPNDTTFVSSRKDIGFVNGLTMLHVKLIYCAKACLVRISLPWAP